MTENMRAYAQAKKGVNMTEHMRAYLAKGNQETDRERSKLEQYLRSSVKKKMGHVSHGRPLRMANITLVSYVTAVSVTAIHNILFSI